MAATSSVEELREKIQMEETAYSMRLPEMCDLISSSRADAEKKLQEVQEQRKKLESLLRTAQETRQQIEVKRSKRTRSIDIPDSETMAPSTLEELRKQALNEEFRASVRKAVAVFVQTMCKYTANPDEEEEGAQPGKAKKTFRDIKASLFKKSGKDSPPPVRLVTLALDIPKGKVRDSSNPASGFSFEFSCSDPAAKTVEDLAEEGGKIVMKFTLKKETKETMELIDAAKGYFEEYFSSRVKEEGGTTDVEIEIHGRTLTATGRLAVKQDKLGGVMGKVQQLASGHIDATSEASSVLGNYSEAHAKESMRALHHLRVTADFSFDEPFENVIRDYNLNWEYFDYLTGKAEVVLERGVYKSLQKVTESFSRVAAAKMSVGGLFKRLTFRVESLFFLALQEDQQLGDLVTEKLKWVTGQSVKATKDLRDKLVILEESVDTIDSLLFDLPAVALQLKFRGFDFFKLASNCCAEEDTVEGEAKAKEEGAVAETATPQAAEPASESC